MPYGSARIDNEFHQNALLAPDRMFVIGLKRPSGDGQGRRAAAALYGPGKAARRRPRPHSDLARNQKFESTPLQRRVRSEPCLIASAAAARDRSADRGHSVAEETDGRAVAPSAPTVAAHFFTSQPPLNARGDYPRGTEPIGWRLPRCGSRKLDRGSYPIQPVPVRHNAAVNARQIASPQTCSRVRCR